MVSIAKSHGDAGTIDPMHPAARLWLDPQTGLVARIERILQQRGVHPAHVVVLLPYAQLMPAARQWWARARPNGFAPRFETTMNWAARLGGPVPMGDDIAFYAGHDLLVAQGLLERAGQHAWRDALAQPLVDAGQQLGRRVAAIAPALREGWGTAARAAVGLGLDAPVLAFEAVVARIALEWTLTSAYAGDVLFGAHTLPAGQGGAEFLVVLQGIHAEPLAQVLLELWGEQRACAIALANPALAQDALQWPAAALHAAQDAEDEAERAAACVLRHIAAGRVPVALAATDRALTRRIRAMLEAQGAAVRDESGWKLSTTRAAAHVMVLLRACAHHASSDSVLDWLKNTAAWQGPALQALERYLRRQGLRDWRPGIGAQDPALAALTAEVDAMRATLQSPRPLGAWLAGLRAALQASGQGLLLAGDRAGQSVAAALRLDVAAQALFEQQLAGSSWGGRRLGLAEFTTWVSSTLEAASFVPAHPAQEQVVILPLAQMHARAFAAAVLPGCDELRLPAAPEPPGRWSTAQRQALGLPTRDVLQAEARAAWCHALQTPHCDVLWRQGDGGGETLLPSPLVQELMQAHSTETATADPRATRAVPAAPSLPPESGAPALALARISASAYADLRRCPYRFFALRMLGLAEQDELDAEVDKRDFGLWLHRVLRLFHTRCAALAPDQLAGQDEALEQSARDATQESGLSPEEFLPFAAAWPRVRDGYLHWLAEQARQQPAPHFEVAEVWREQALGPLTLIGQIDRIDRLPGGEALVIDYKTEGPEKTRERVRDALEDTQLAFYAALLPDDTLHAAYLNVGERDGTRAFAQPDVLAARDALVQGLLDDTERIAAGAPLLALGEGVACEHCAARGLCRKDFWEKSGSSA
ncbi:MAG TPA: PD-(D/E)XK nuclease family protein [Burkholderiaceae bacterium]